MTPEQIKVFVINPNNWYNKGDVSNRLGLVKALRREFSNNIAIFIETLTLKEDLKYFKKYDVGTVESIFSVDHANANLSYAFRLIRVAKRSFFLLISVIMYRIFKVKRISCGKEQVFLRNFISSDLIISSPGGFLQDYNIFSSLIPNLFLIFLSKILGKPVVIYAQSIGPFRNRILRLLCRFILNQVDIVILREKVSERYLEEAKISRPKVFITADATFSLEPQQYCREKYYKKLLKFVPYKDRGILVGVTVLGEYFLNRKRHRLLENYVKSLATAIDYVVDRLNAIVVFIPQVLNQSENATAHLVADLVKNKNRVTIIEEDFSPEEMMKFIDCMDLLIGTRMHSNIFALIMNVPVIAIAYEHKTHGIMKMLDLENWVIDIKHIEGDKLISKIDELYKNRWKIREYVSKKVEDIRARSLYSAEIVRQWYLSNYKHNERVVTLTSSIFK